jgi:hypothetical protein
VSLRMTLSEDLARLMGDTVQEVPTTLGTDIVLSVLSSVGPSITIVTTSVFSSGAFRAALRRWCSQREEPVRFSGVSGRNRLSIDLDEHTAEEMADEVSRIVAKFIATPPDAAAGPVAKNP